MHKMNKYKKIILFLGILILLINISCSGDSGPVIIDGDANNDNDEMVEPIPNPNPSDALTPSAAHLKMTRGINMGRSLELDNNGTPDRIKEYFFDDFKAAGFDFIRIPIKWEFHTQTTAPYTVDASWLDRVEQVIDWGLERGFIIIINSHHDKWFYENYGVGNNNARFDAIWTQVANRFKDKSENLFFEIINEPKGLTRTNSDALNARILAIIRENNPTRIVVYSGNDYSGKAAMMAAKIPNDDYIIATFHDYTPWDFSLNGTGTWGTTVQQDVVKAIFKEVSDWSKLHNIPVYIGEFGSVNKAPQESREKLYKAFVEEAIRNNIAFSVWHDFGDFGIYLPNNTAGNRWNFVKDIIINTNP